MSANEAEITAEVIKAYERIVVEREEMRAHRIVCNADHRKPIGGDGCICIPISAYYHWLRGVAKHNPRFINDELKAIGLVLAPIGGTQNADGSASA